MKTIFLVTLFFPMFLAAQPSGVISGTVSDVSSGQKLSGASINAVSATANYATVTDNAGSFKLHSISAGRYDVYVRLNAYEDAIYTNIYVSDVKGAFLEIDLAERINDSTKPDNRRVSINGALLNRMTLQGVRTITADEASRHAGGFNDPARLATTFAGVSGGTGNNGISVRGNSPRSLHWRMEGVEVANPVHFSDITGAGGGIVSALSPHALGSSGFFTGAFPAEYGNALAGVFDMQLRNGSSDKYEHALHVGTMDAGLSSEGPFVKGKKASYIFNYRYSSLGFLGDILPQAAGDAAGMRYQDMTFKMNFPTQKAGSFSVWGIGIYDHFMQRPPQNTADWDNAFEHDADFRQAKIVGGAGHKLTAGKKSYVKTVLAVNYIQNHTTMDQAYADGNMLRVANMKNDNWTLAFNTFLNTKFSASHTNRTGFNVTGLFFDLDHFMSEDINRIPPGNMVNYATGRGNSLLLSAFTQSSFRISSRLTANAGLLAIHFRLNGNSAVEPRAGIQWQAFAKHSFGIAYGKHSQRETLDYYFVKSAGGEEAYPNKTLDVSRAHHFVMAYEWAITEHLNFKLEPYYQYMYDIPLEQETWLPLVNHHDFYLTKALINGGKGKNYGIDATLEHGLHGGYYYLLTGSLFDAQCTGVDGKWQNTRLNRNYIVNVLGGKEWDLGKQKQNVLTVSIRCTVQGGERFIPIDEAASKIQKSIVFDHAQAYKEQLPAEFVCHFTAGYKIHCKRMSHEISVKVINITGNAEFDNYTYNYHTDSPEMYMSAGMIPNISYRIEF